MGMISGREALRDASPLLEQAVLLDPECGDAWASMGVIQGTLGWRWKQAEYSFQRAIELNPGMASILLKYSSFYLLAQHRFDEAQSVIREALERQPNSPRISLHYVIAACCCRDYAEARAHGLRALEIAPRFGPLHRWLGRTCCLQGEYEQALVHFRAASSLEYGRHVIGYEGYCYARLGRVPQAHRVLDRLLRWKGPGVVPDYIFATLYLGLGETGKCLDRMDTAVESRCPWMPLLLSVDPLFEELRREPRALALAKKLKLSPARGGEKERPPEAEISPRRP
jgi:Tfp pilus assembly protein PilF